jgi:protein gp37
MTTIEWTDESWNPVTGCTKVSAGCKNCYAERVFSRVYGGDVMIDQDQLRARKRRFTDVQIHPDRLEQPLRWRAPRRVFVNPMSDLFHEDVPEDFIDKVFAEMAFGQRHTFQILTKRPQRMLDYMATGDRRELVACPVMHALDEIEWPLDNVWLGVSVENQETADERIPLLLQTPAAVRFVSYEPALGPVDFRFDWMPHGQIDSMYPRLDWVIVGGESGPRARAGQRVWPHSASNWEPAR